MKLSQMIHNCLWFYDITLDDIDPLAVFLIYSSGITLPFTLSHATSRLSQDRD